MFGHLKAEDFTNLLEGADLTDQRRAHLQSCARCREKFESVQAVRSQIEDLRLEGEEYVPEPDWSEFRSDVRNALLSRSVRREHARGWLGGFSLKPAMALGISMLMVIGLTIATGVFWNQQYVEPESNQTQVATVETLPVEENLNSLAAVSQSDVFDDLLGLNADEADSLQMILEDLTQKGVTRQ